MHSSPIAGLRRVVQAGFVSFWRNGLVSFASIFVMMVTLFIIGAILVSSAFLNLTLAEVQDKVDVNVYFRLDAPESEILTLQSQLEALPEVKSVEYIDRDEALNRFIERNKDNSLILQALDELDDNPLGAVLNVKAVETSQYAGIASFLEGVGPETLGPDSIIDKSNFPNNKLVIDRLTEIIGAVNSIGAFIALVLIIMAILVAFNTVRLAIYNAREEIGVMRLVGASSAFVRGPFIVEGIMYGIFASIISLALLYSATLWVSKTTSSFFGGLDFASYYSDNFWMLFAILLLSGVVLGIISSSIAVRRYLNK